MKKYIQLPQGYLSYTQMQLWLSDPEKYKALYFDRRDELRTSNSGQKFGKEVADALEQERETGDLLTDAAMLLLKKYDVRDQEITAELKEKNGRWLKLIAKPDTFNSMNHQFREYKTGKHEWTLGKATRHPQMIFYAVVIYLKYGEMNRSAYLDWIETADTPEGIKPTGRVESFLVPLTPNQYFECQAEMLRVAKEIEIAWASHVTNPELINF